MRRVVKTKTLAPAVRLRKSAVTASQTSRRAFPAWITSDDRAMTFPATSVTPRVRSALVLRLVAKSKSGKPKGASDGHGAR